MTTHAISTSPMADTPQHDKVENFFQARPTDDDYWTEYLLARPKYSRAFYDKIYAYHRAHGNAFDTAIDIGTGPAQVAEELAHHFAHVVAADSEQGHLATAAERLTSSAVAGKIEFLRSPAEDTASHLPPASADLASVAMAIALMDAPRAVASVAALLRPGGTFAVWHYGKLIFAEPETAPRCQDVYDRLVDRVFLGWAAAVERVGPGMRAAWMRALEIMDGFLDGVGLPEGTWADVERWKWNADMPMALYEEPGFEAGAYPSLVGRREKVVEVVDRGFWGEEWGVRDVRRHLRMMSALGQEEERDQEIRDLWEELEEAMGGAGKRTRVTWPVVLILATKK